MVSEFFSSRDGSWNSHVDLGLWADAMLIAPATASTIGKMANGIADNILVTTYLSCKAPVLVAPAMDLDMYAHPATQRNLQTLRLYGNVIIEPASGELASGLVGKGRMEEPEAIVDAMTAFFASHGKLSNKRILITAGPTFEKIDPVRFIGNFSSGKMGFALAEGCARCGAEVTLIAGPVSLAVKHPNIRRIDVQSAGEMHAAAAEHFPSSDAAILCAAVADYRPSTVAGEKIKREDRSEMTLSLTANPDIAASLGAMKRGNQITVGFALETADGIAQASSKLQRKNLDFIVLNPANEPGAGFGVDTNRITIIDSDGNRRACPLQSKREAAAEIINELISRLS